MLSTASSILELPASPASVVRIEHLFISPGHNFFGHHGQPAGAHEILAVNALECVARRGIRGDRFFDFKEDYKGQITFFSMETFEALRRELKLPNARPEATRRNAFLRGLDLPTLVGCEFRIQGIRFQGVEESRPCYWMNAALGPGAEEWLKGRGGLRCRILSNGTLTLNRPDGSPVSESRLTEPAPGSGAFSEEIEADSHRAGTGLNF